MIWRYCVTQFFFSYMAYYVMPTFGKFFNKLFMSFLSLKNKFDSTRYGSLVSMGVYAVIALLSLLDIYFIGAWSSFCVYRILAQISSPGASLAWLYYILSFLFCVGPLFAISAYGLNTIISAFLFVLFCILSAPLKYLYGWLWGFVF